MATLLPRQNNIFGIVLKQIGILLFDYLVSKQTNIRLIFCPNNNNNNIIIIILFLLLCIVQVQYIYVIYLDQ